MKKSTKIRIEILSLLNDLEIAERIDLIESIGKRLRQQNSIETAKEVQGFKVRTGNVKKIEDYSPVLKNK